MDENYLRRFVMDQVDAKMIELRQYFQDLQQQIVNLETNTKRELNKHD